MGRNRRNQSGAVWLIPALKAGVLCSMLGGSAVGYVLQKNLLHELGQGITRREAVLERLRWENKMRAQHLANLQLPLHIERRVREQRLGLGKPQPGQTIWLAEPMSDQRTGTTSTVLIVQSGAAVKSP